MIWVTPRFTRADTLFPYTTLFRSVLARWFRLEINMPEAVAEQRERYHSNIRLVGFECRQIGDPGTGNAKRDEQKRHDTASRGQPRADQRARCKPARPVALGDFGSNGSSLFMR